MAYLFLEWVAEVDDSLLLHQALRESRLALLAPGCSGRLDFLKAGDGRAACGLGGYTLASAHSALLAMYFDFPVVFSLPTPSAAVIVSDLLKIVFVVKVTRGRPATLADGEWNGHVGWRAVLVGLIPVDPLDIAISRHRPAIKCVKGRLAANVLRARWLGRARGMAPLINVDVDVNVSVNDRPATIGRKGLVGDFGWCRLMKQLGRGPARRPVEAIMFVVSLSFHDRRSSTRAVLMNIDIAVASGVAVVLLEAEVIVVIGMAAAATATSDATTTTTASSHALKPVAIPSFTTARRLFKAIQIARRGAVGRHGCAVKCGLLLRD